MFAQLTSHDEIKNDLLSATDGTVTKFVVINRSLELASSNKYTAYEIACVLDEILQDFEEISSNEFSNRV